MVSMRGSIAEPYWRQRRIVSKRAQRPCNEGKKAHLGPMHPVEQLGTLLQITSRCDEQLPLPIPLEKDLADGARLGERQHWLARFLNGDDGALGVRPRVVSHIRRRDGLRRERERAAHLAERVNGFQLRRGKLLLVTLVELDLVRELKLCAKVRYEQRGISSPLRREVGTWCRPEYAPLRTARGYAESESSRACSVVQGASGRGT